MTKRLKILTSHITFCNTFADVGCDHGLVSKFVLDNSLASEVIATDISKKSLDKAIKLLGDKPNFTAICCDGFNGIKNVVDQAIISGMGGEEIVKILKDAKDIPNRLILSPQKNSYKVRKFLVDNFYKITNDYTIFDDKFYDIIVAEKGKDFYTENELIFGKDNLKNLPCDFTLKIKSEINLKMQVLKTPNLSSENKESVLNEVKKLKEIINEDY